MNRVIQPSGDEEPACRCRRRIVDYSFVHVPASVAPGESLGAARLGESNETTHSMRREAILGVVIAAHFQAKRSFGLVRHYSTTPDDIVGCRAWRSGPACGNRTVFWPFVRVLPRDTSLPTRAGLGP